MTTARNYDREAIEPIAAKIEQAGKPQAAREFGEAMQRAHQMQLQADAALYEAWGIYHAAMRGEEGGK